MVLDCFASLAMIARWLSAAHACATLIGFELAAKLTQTFGSAVLRLTPLSFLFSTARNSKEFADVLSLGLGLAFYPIASLVNSGLDILFGGVLAGTIAFGVHKWREGHQRVCRRLAGAASAPARRRDPKTRCGACWACGSAAELTKVPT
jgi:hypothetical protein